jgi:type VI secretion system secreted protein Hcp
MKNKLLIVLSLSAVLFLGSLASVNAQTSFNTYLSLDGVQGSAGPGSGSIEILSWSWGATQTGTYNNGGGSGSGKVSMQDFTFTKKFDKASPMLYQLSKGKRAKTALFTLNSGGTDYFRIDMSDVTVKSYGLSGGGSGGVPTESVTISFAKMTVSYDLKAAKK